MQFSGIDVCRLDGSGHDAEGNKLDASFCPYFQRALLGDTTIAFTQFREGSGTSDAVLTIPLWTNGKITGALRISLDQELIRSLLSINTFLENEDVYLVRRNAAGTRLRYDTGLCVFGANALQGI